MTGSHHKLLSHRFYHSGGKVESNHIIACLVSQKRIGSPEGMPNILLKRAFCYALRCLENPRGAMINIKSYISLHYFRWFFNDSFWMVLVKLGYQNRKHSNFGDLKTAFKRTVIKWTKKWRTGNVYLIIFRTCHPIYLTPKTFHPEDTSPHFHHISSHFWKHLIMLIKKSYFLFSLYCTHLSLKLAN